jgi:hypothetical protein
MRLRDIIVLGTLVSAIYALSIYAAVEAGRSSAPPPPACDCPAPAAEVEDMGPLGKAAWFPEGTPADYISYDEEHDEVYGVLDGKDFRMPTSPPTIRFGILDDEPPASLWEWSGRTGALRHTIYWPGGAIEIENAYFPGASTDVAWYDAPDWSECVVVASPGAKEVR